MDNLNNYPRIAIIILNYNGWSDTIECLESVLRNDYPNYQVVIVDNNSPNNSMKYIKAWAGGRQEVLTPEPTYPLYYLSHPSVKKSIPYVYYTCEEAEKGGNYKLENELMNKWADEKSNINSFIHSAVIPSTNYPLVFIQTGENLGFAGGNNVGIRYALQKDDFKYIWILNNDTVITPTTLTSLIKIATKTKPSIVGSRIFDYFKKKEDFAGSKWPHLLFGIRRNNKDMNQEFWASGDATGSSILIDSNILKVCLNERGFFIDPNFFMYCEETDFCLYAYYKKNYKIFIAKDSIVYHKEAQSSGGKGNPMSYYYVTRNKIHLANSWSPITYKILCHIYYIPSRFFIQTLKSLKKKSNFQSVIKGLIDGYKRKRGRLWNKF